MPRRKQRHWQLWALWMALTSCRWTDNIRGGCTVSDASPAATVSLDVHGDPLMLDNGDTIGSNHENSAWEALVAKLQQRHAPSESKRPEKESPPLLKLGWKERLQLQTSLILLLLPPFLDVNSPTCPNDHHRTG